MHNNYLSVYKNKRVIVTGHTGFKGSWLITWLNMIGANVAGIALDPPSTPSHFDEISKHLSIKDLRVNINNHELINKLVSEFQPEFIFHLAAQPLVRYAYENPIETYQTNVIGTVNILESLRLIKNQCVAILITSDKCYDNVEWIYGYRENDKLGGPDPYSASKGAAEIAINSYFRSFFSSPNSNIRIASVRAGNVIGGGDWAKDRIVPDVMTKAKNREIVNLRNPNATRPWQHVLEPLSGYLNLGAELYSSNKLNGESFNFGPSDNINYSVLDLVKSMSTHWPSIEYRDKSEVNNFHESNLLKLNCDKALAYLDWSSVLNFHETSELTTSWYREFYNEESVNTHSMTVEQIIKYTSLALQRGKKWAI
jgi:CDP-glucose 4,6-dehydratase